MIRPIGFRMNEETAVNNYYQKVLNELSSENVQENALREFDAFVNRLTDKGVRVVVVACVESQRQQSSSLYGLV